MSPRLKALWKDIYGWLYAIGLRLLRWRVPQWEDDPGSTHSDSVTREMLAVKSPGKGPMKRVLLVSLVSLGFGLVFAMAGFFIPIVFARSQGLALLAIVTGPYGFIVGVAVGFAWESLRQNSLNAQRIISILYIVCFLMSLYYFYFIDRITNHILLGATIVQAVVLIAICGILMLERSFQGLPLAIRSRQKIFAIAAIMMTAMLFFPPYKQDPMARSSGDFASGYAFLIDQNFDASTHYANYTVDIERIVLQWLLVFGISYLYYFFVVGGRRK